MGADDLHHLRLDLLGRLVLAERGEILRAEVRGQDDDRVGEIDRAALAVGQAAVVEHLQQDVEHVAVRLLDLVEQHDLVGPPPHRLGQHAAFLIADIARRSADQPRDRMLLHELATCRCGPSRARRRTGIRRAPWSARSCRRRSGRGTGTSRAAGSGPAGPARARRTAADTAFTASSWPITRAPISCFHLEQLLALALHHPLDRDSGPAADDAGDVLVGDFLAQHRALGRAACASASCFSSSGMRPYCSSPALARSPLRCACSSSMPGCVELLLDLGFGADLVLLGLPALGQLGRLLLEVGELFLELAEPVLRRLVLLLLQRLALDLELDDPAVEILDLLGLGLDLHADPARRLVHQVDRLVGQEAVGDVAVAAASPRRRSRRR